MYYCQGIYTNNQKKVYRINCDQYNLLLSSFFFIFLNIYNVILFAGLLHIVPFTLFINYYYFSIFSVIFVVVGKKCSRELDKKLV